MTIFSNSKIVVDSGFVYLSLLPNPQQAKLQQRFNTWQTNGVTLHAPTLWHYEFVSAITKAVYFKQLSRAEAEVVLELGKIFDIQFYRPDAVLNRIAFDWTLKLQRTNAYDSFYLALAQQLQCPFWTADQRLYRAANVAWVHYVGAESD
ncbi:MAG: type II toxin-antitoxin system VapC family toxin [Caldilineaceae bacterium]